VFFRKDEKTASACCLSAASSGAVFETFD